MHSGGWGMLQPLRSGGADRFHPAVLLPCRPPLTAPHREAAMAFDAAGSLLLAGAPLALEAIWPKAADIS